MSESFPTQEVVRLIAGQARVEEKLDAFLRAQESRDKDIHAKVSSIDLRVTSIDARVKQIEDKALKQGGYIAAMMAVISSAMIFFVPWAKSKLGL
jgi:hypothetical protein